MELDALSTNDLLLWDETNDYDELPVGIKQWLNGHVDLWFDGKPASSFEELVPIYQQFKSVRNFPLPLEDTAPSTVILALMETHARCLGPLRKKPQNIKTDTYFPVIGRFSTMEVECSSCHAPLPPDRNACWLISSPPRYIVKDTRHICKQTNRVTRKRYAIPRNKVVPFNLSGSLSRKARKPAVIKSKRWQEIFMRTENYRDSLPEEIETLCETCQSKLKDLNLSDGEGNVIDKVPRWTVQDPPRYVLHRLKCPVCKGNRKFVPVNPHIPFIPAKTLRDLEQSFRHVADSVAVDAPSRRYPVAEWIDKFLLS